MKNLFVYLFLGMFLTGIIACGGAETKEECKEEKVKCEKEVIEKEIIKEEVVDEYEDFEEWVEEEYEVEEE